MTAAIAFRRHAQAFGSAACALAAANWFADGTLWSFWPLAAWGTVFAVHYLVYKAKTVGESWVEERTADLHSKSYDAHHIDIIAGRHDGNSPGGQAPPPK